MNIQQSARRKARNGRAIPKIIVDGQTITLTHSQISTLYTRIDSLVLPASLLNSLRKQSGPALRVSAKLMKELTKLNPDLQTDSDDPEVSAMVEPVSTTVVVLVILAAAAVGFGLGYVLSEAADDDGEGKTVITNNGGDVTVCPDDSDAK